MQLRMADLPPGERSEGLPMRSRRQVTGALDARREEARQGELAHLTRHLRLSGSFGLMTKSPRVREQHIAVFGEAGSGKTVLVSSFFGPTQEGAYENDLWDLVAEDAGQGSRLNRQYVGMRDHATAPGLTRFSATTYSFKVQLKGQDQKAAKGRPFDHLKLAWHDYPGEWFTESPSSEEESNRRVDTFRALMRSDVALLLVDGQKLLDHQGEEERYLSALFTNFRQGLLRVRGDLQDGEQRLVEFPRIWLVALSKADLFPNWDVHTFRDLVEYKAEKEIARLRSTIEDLVDTPEALSVGEDFMLLSSAKFSLAADAREPMSIDVTQRLGVDLILPLAAVLPLERRVQWHDRMEIPRRVLDTLADGAGAIAIAIAGSKYAPVAKLRAKMPRLGPDADKASDAIAWAAKLVGTQLKEANAHARERRDVLAATLTQFRIDLERGVTDKLLIKSRR